MEFLVDAFDGARTPAQPRRSCWVLSWQAAAAAVPVGATHLELPRCELLCAATKLR